MNIFSALTGKSKPTNQLKLKKDASGDWLVTKGSTILYIGTKDKCETYMSYAS